ncbi:MAG: hypothetical protein IKU10_07265, partial [Clostridia bacterium]|nr:hypothetical protein [Clostridia bacterium]
MIYAYIGIGLLILLVLLMVFLAYLCFRLTFYVTKKQKAITDPFAIPNGEIYEPYRETMVGWMKETDAMSKTEYAIQAFDGLTLRGNYYEYKKGAPIE